MFLCVIGLTSGCAHSHDRFYYTDGSICAEVRSWVLGAGDIGKYVIDEFCDVTVIHDTKGTGISKNATELGGKISKGLTEGAVDGLIPLP